jgi:signal transduction histidine kinase
VKLSLRNQLSLWVGAATLVIVFSTIFITQQITVWTLEASLDGNIQKRAFMVASLISSDITTDEASYTRLFNDLARQELSFVSSQLRVISPSGKPIVEFGKISPTVIQQMDYDLQVPDISSGHFSTLFVSGIDPLRSYSISVPDPRTRSTLAYVQIIESLGQIEQARRGLWRNGLIIGLIGGLIAVTIGQILIRRGFKPLQTIVEGIDKADYSNLKSSMASEVNSPELQQLAKSLSAMWMRLDMAVNEKRRAVGNMSHDLRTPLTALQGQLEVLLEQPSLAQEARESIERMLNETRRLTRMVKNMLLNVQLETKPTLLIEEINLREIVDQVVGDMWKLMEGLRVNIIANENIMIPAGRDLLIQMLMNVVDNAIKFTPKGGKIDIELSSEDKWAILRISDTGRGIPAEELPHITEAFYRVSLSRKAAGEGARLGLAIVKQIVELHYGKVNIQSREGYGTTITVSLPLKSSGNKSAITNVLHID